jgi:hypothetical protein
VKRKVSWRRQRPELGCRTKDKKRSSKILNYILFHKKR